ncbi:diguanylate cyclase [Pseudoalteromonas sp. YIC-656]|uniref:GGDEF domain-containing protein n=1 Tax=Pseudoalteromonas pernae TaxID=3118054 RepID=UPI003241D2B4
MRDTINASDKDKARFLRVFAFIGAVTSFLMSISSYGDGYILLSILLAASVIVFVSPFVVKGKDAVIAVVMLYTLYFLMGYLVISGGSHGTGPLWLFIVSPVTFFIRGLKRGAFDLVLLAGTISVLFIYTPEIGLYDYQSFYFPSRVMLCFSILCVLGGFYEYYRNKYSLQLMQQVEINRKMASTDSMTELYNRRYTLECLEGRHYGEDAVFILMDVDNFKQINDNYGHVIGDEVLMYIADTLRKVCAGDGIVSRWGGEEFLIVVQSQHAHKAHTIAKSIHESLRASPFKRDIHQFNVTLSIGVHQRQAGESIDHCLNIADKRLYKAKTSGKNRTVSDDEVEFA